MLAVHWPGRPARAVATGDEKTLTAVPGIGKKGAEAAHLELKDRLGPVPFRRPLANAAAPRPMAWQDQLPAGLLGLG